MIDPASMNRARLKKFDAHCVLMEEHKDPEKLPQVSKTFGIVKAMDLVPGHLHEKLGVKKIALSYVIRQPSTPPALLPQQNDNAHPDMTTAEKYGGQIMDKLIDYNPHLGAAYVEDNATAYHILQGMVAGTSFESSLTGFQCARNRRAAYQALLLHNLGSSKWDKIIEDAETYCL